MGEGGGIFNNRILFSGHFCVGQDCDGRGQSHDRGISPVPLPTRENPVKTCIIHKHELP